MQLCMHSCSFAQNLEITGACTTGLLERQHGPETLCYHAARTQQRVERTKGSTNQAIMIPNTKPGHCLKHK